MPWFEEFNKQYSVQGLAILGLADDVDAGKDTIAKVGHKTGVTYPILLTRWQSPEVVCTGTELDYLPMSFYVDRNGGPCLRSHHSRSSQDCKSLYGIIVC